MKYLPGIFVCLILAVAIAAAQQETPSKPTPSIQPTAEALMKAQAAAEKALNKREESSVEELKKLVEREIAKSATLTVTTTIQEPVTQKVPPAIPKDLKLEFKTKIVMVDGSPYVRMGNIIVPMPGSECFLPEDVSAARFQRAQARLAEILKAEAQAEPVKKD